MSKKINTAEITYFGQPTKVACDRKCNKSWGISQRPKKILDKKNEDDCYFLSDREIKKSAPKNPGTYEGGHAKPESPDEFPNKWCVRECERCWTGKPEEKIVLPNFNKRLYNIPRETK